MCNLGVGRQNARRRSFDSVFLQQYLPQFTLTCRNISELYSDFSNPNARHPSAFVGTEMTTDLTAKAPWANPQGYHYKADESNEKSVNEWKENDG